MTVKLRPTNEILPASTRGRTLAVARIFGACAAVAACAVLAGPANAGHGAVSYENPKKIEEQKKREREAATRQPAVAPVPATPAAAVPAAAPVATPRAAVPAGDRDRVFATTVRRELSELAVIAEEQIASGADPELATLAGRTLESARRQMAELDRWLAAHPQPTSAK